MSKVTSIILFVLFSWINIGAGIIPQKPNPPRLVNDFAGVLGKNATNQLEEYLVAFAHETSTQIVIVTVPDLQGHAVDDFAVRLAHDWGVGQAADDNGIVLLVKPRYENEKGQAFVAVGYGLEGAVPDATAKMIVENEMIPHFRNDDYYSGILAAINVLIDLTRGEYTSETYLNRSGSKGSTRGALFILIFGAVMIISAFSKTKRAQESSIGHSLPFWVILSLMGSGSRRHSGHFGNFSSGGGSFGGGSFGSGGFGGFGGGGFGGGGAGGSW